MLVSQIVPKQSIPGHNSLENWQGDRRRPVGGVPWAYGNESKCFGMDHWRVDLLFQTTIQTFVPDHDPDLCFRPCSILAFQILVP